MLVKMKKWTLYALKQDRDALLMALQKDGSVMIESEGEKKGLEGAEEVSAQLEKTGQVAFMQTIPGLGHSPLI